MALDKVVLDPLLRLALSVQSNKGVYALLLGSGVSHSAGILTGWGITLDLIKKLAHLEGQGGQAQTDPEAWYVKRFGEPPDYSKLLDTLAATPSERMSLLRSYFEPNEEDREQGRKRPTPAHQAIAELVQLGFIRVILETNFDKLMEQALEERGIHPTVISTVDALKGAMPAVHSQVTVVKLHGDYLDTRILNTPDELSKYDPKLDSLLDRVFDEYGLVVCGWSAAWDTALRNAILRCPNRRFSTFYLSRGLLTEEAKLVTTNRRADILAIKGADDAFTELLAKVHALEDIAQSHPLSIAEAKATTKRYLVDPVHRVRLHDLVSDETERVCRALTSPDHLRTGGDNLDKRLINYEGATERLATILAVIGYHGDREQTKLIVRVIQRLLEAVQADQRTSGDKLNNYPALLVVYAAGIASLAAERYFNLAGVLLGPKYLELQGHPKRPAVRLLNVGGVFGKLWVRIPDPKDARTFKTANERIFYQMRSWLRDYLPGPSTLDDSFDIFEYVIGLTYMDIDNRTVAPPARYLHQRYSEVTNRDLWRRLPPGDFTEKARALDMEWPLFREGFFGGSLSRLDELVTRHAEWAQAAANDLHWGAH